MPRNFEDHTFGLCEKRILMLVNLDETFLQKYNPSPVQDIAFISYLKDIEILERNERNYKFTRPIWGFARKRFNKFVEILGILVSIYVIILFYLGGGPL